MTLAAKGARISGATYARSDQMMLSMMRLLSGFTSSALSHPR